MSRLGPGLEDVEDGEWCSDSFEGQGWFDCLQDRGVDEIGEVRNDVRRSSVQEHVHLEFAAVFICLEDLERAEAVWLRVTDVLLSFDSVVILLVSDVCSAVIANFPEAVIITWQVLCDLLRCVLRIRW